jgi:hypothetical protein
MSKNEYVTERILKQRIVDTLQRRILEEDVLAKQTQGYTRRYSLEQLREPYYQKWAKTVVDKSRKAGLLITDRQKEDLDADRPLRRGDRVRFIGETRIEQTSDPQNRQYTRHTGEEGSVIEAIDSVDGFFYRIRPDAPVQALQETGPTVFIADCRVLQNTPGYFEFERIPD